MVAVLSFLATRIGGLLFQECFIALGNGFQIAAILGRSGLTQRIREGLIASHVEASRRIPGLGAARSRCWRTYG